MKTLIIAPHVDDEAIGCWSLLSSPPAREIHVLYLFELDEVRRQEALAAAAYFGFTPHFTDPLHTLASDLGDLGAVWVPAITDGHSDHKRANLAYRRHATGFYSVDFSGPRTPLAGAQAATKERVLRELYPSQSGYFDQHPECFLFENLQPTDLRCSATKHYGATGYGLTASVRFSPATAHLSDVLVTGVLAGLPVLPSSAAACNELVSDLLGCFHSTPASLCVDLHTANETLRIEL